MVITDSNFHEIKSKIYTDLGFIVDNYQFQQGLFSLFPTDNTRLTLIQIYGNSLTASGNYKQAVCSYHSVNRTVWQINETSHSQSVQVNTPYLFVTQINANLRNSTNFFFSGYIFTLYRKIQ